MADDANKQTTAGITKGGNDKKNPLDVLEDLLSEIDGADGGKGASKKDTKPSGPTPEEIEAAKKEKELEEKRLAYEQQKKEQAVIDAQRIAQQREALLSDMQNSEANQARQQQDEEKKHEAEQKEKAGEGFEIVQLDHTKV